MIKQFLVSAFVLTMILVNPALAANNSDSSKSVIVVMPNTPITKIIIQGNPEVILTSDEAGDIIIEGDYTITKKVRLVHQDNELEVVAPDFKTGTKLVIRIPAPQLQQLQINGDGRVSSESYLRSAKLEVYINGACNVSLRSAGKITIKADPEIHLQYFKNTPIKLGAAKL